ncbi:class I SAM-dependent rRNA methyltransferase [Geminisphaera colitermitum]|uniref:class I SAM-dependent rRNA methyltransferase n=1 Tax=Geminisphaera colitermitum TaxID=1148786 RepID=UPI0002F5828E|nr:class I SAM-dependent rRNA methyltransferase [Geminisphaera colitermitum]
MNSEQSNGLPARYEMGDDRAMSKPHTSALPGGGATTASTPATTPAMHPVTPALKLKANAKARVLAGHPWVFANEVEALLPAELDGEVVECRDRAGRTLGTGIYNSRSQIIWRRLSRRRVTLDRDWLRGALQRALVRRQPLPEHARLVWSESDELPGVVVDRFGATLVLQVQTVAMEKRLDTLLSLLDELLAPEEIIVRNDAPIRRLEGLPLHVTTRSGRPWTPRWERIDGLDYWLDLQAGQKTGFYLDQREQHAAVAKYCEGKRVLDAFCNQGPFALHAARAGATEVLGLDSAEDAIAQARRNVERNHLAADGRVRFEVANVFDWFNANSASSMRPSPPPPSPARSTTAPASAATAATATAGLWDVIVLDPPPFAKSKSALPGALRGYKEINLRALQRLAPGGVLATYTCSHHMQDADLRGVLAAAAVDARRDVRILECCHQPADHPVLVTMPESEYLRGFIVRAE